MAQLPVGLVLVGWNGPATPLASAPWKGNVGGGIFKPNSTRSALISFKPSATFPAVTQLVPGEIYLFRVTTAFTLADALLTVVQAPAANQSPTVTLSLSANTAQPGGSVTLTAAATDPDGSISKVEYYHGTTKVGESTTAPTFSFTYANLAAGVYALTAVAHDNAGGSTRSLAQALSVQATANQVPQLTLTSSAPGITLGESVTLTAAATDPDGIIAQVEFFNGLTPLATDPTSPYTYVFTPTSAGAYALTAKATDSHGAATTALPVPLLVTAVAAPGPLVVSRVDDGDASNRYTGFIAVATRQGNFLSTFLEEDTTYAGHVAAGQTVKVEVTTSFFGGQPDEYFALYGVADYDSPFTVYDNGVEVYHYAGQPGTTGPVSSGEIVGEIFRTSYTLSAGEHRFELVKLPTPANAVNPDPTNHANKHLFYDGYATGRRNAPATGEPTRYFEAAFEPSFQ